MGRIANYRFRRRRTGLTWARRMGRIEMSGDDRRLRLRTRRCEAASGEASRFLRRQMRSQFANRLVLLIADAISGQFHVVRHVLYRPTLETHLENLLLT